MRSRRRRIKSVLAPGEAVLSVPAFPLMGVRQFCDPPLSAFGPVACSIVGYPAQLLRPRPCLPAYLPTFLLTLTFLLP